MSLDTAAQRSTGVPVAGLPARPRRDLGPIVRRPRLVSRLLAGAESPVVLIDAPAGYGKSTVLSEWEASDRRPFAWLTLAGHHNDPVLLTASIAAAIAEHEPIDEDVFAALHGAGPGTLKVAIPRMLESLQRSRTPFVLALDDVHAISDPDSLNVMRAIGDGLPPGSQVALASRREPSIHLARLRANRALVEMHAPDLAMTRGEAGSLLRACGLGVQPASVDVLVQRTEGWPAALYLAALSLSGTDDPDGAAAQFAGDDRLVADYLRDEFIASLEPDELSFLTKTSILDELSGDVCDAVLKAEGSAERLHGLARANAFLVPLDGRDRRYRYHALLREMLASELHRLEPGEEAELHARASRWYAERGDFDRAVPHATSADDPEAAGDLIWSRTAVYASAGRSATIERWLDRFTEAQIELTPTLALARATFHLSDGDGAQVDHWTTRALVALEGCSRKDGEALKVAAATIRASGAAREGAVRMGEDAAAAFALLQEGSPWRSICLLLEGVSQHLTGNRDLARSTLEDGARLGAVGAPHIRTLCLAQLALLALDEGDPDQAARLGDEATAQAERFGLNDYPTSALLFAVAALVRARRGRTERASRDVRRSNRLLHGLNELSPWYEVEARIALARALALLDDIGAARAQLADAGRLLHRIPDAPVLHDWLEQAWREADSESSKARWPLTPAELRLLHHLPTHLTFREIAEQLVVSTNTVKTQARSVYGKLGVSSRAEAVACAQAAGLLDGDGRR